MRLRNPHDPETGFDLLRHQRLGRGHKDDLPGRVPAVEVIHDHGADERLAQTCRETNQRIVQ